MNATTAPARTEGRITATSRDGMRTTARPSPRGKFESGSICTSAERSKTRRPARLTWARPPQAAGVSTGRASSLRATAPWPVLLLARTSVEYGPGRNCLPRKWNREPASREAQPAGEQPRDRYQCDSKVVARAAASTLPSRGTRDTTVTTNLGSAVPEVLRRERHPHRIRERQGASSEVYTLRAAVNRSSQRKIVSRTTSSCRQEPARMIA